MTWACLCLCLSLEYCFLRAEMSTLSLSLSTFCCDGPNGHTVVDAEDVAEDEAVAFEEDPVECDREEPNFGDLM